MRLFDKMAVAAIAPFFILSLLGYGYMKYGLPWEHGRVKERMHAHLGETYHETFELGSIRYDLLNGGTYYTDATSEQTNVPFYVEASDTEVMDDYSHVYWQKYGDRFILPPIREYYQQVNASSLSLDVEMLQRIEDATDQEELKENAVWHISFSLPYEICKKNETMEFEKAYMALRTLKKENIQVGSYVVYFTNCTFRLPEEEGDNITSIESLEQFLKQ